MSCINAFVYQFDADICRRSKLRHLFDDAVSGEQGKMSGQTLKNANVEALNTYLFRSDTLLSSRFHLSSFFSSRPRFSPSLTRRPPVLSKKRHCQDEKTSDNDRKLVSVTLKKLLKWFSRVLTVILYHVVKAFLMIKVRSCIYIVRRRIRKCSWSRPLWTAFSNTWLCLSSSLVCKT